MNGKFIRFWALSQIVLGSGLLAGNLCFSFVVLPSLQDKAAKASENSRQGAEALLSAADAYEKHSGELFSMTNSLTEIGGKLGDASKKTTAIGVFFNEQGPKFRDFVTLLKAVPGSGPLISDTVKWCLNSGTNLCAVGESLGSVATAVSAQGEALATYCDNGHDKTLLAMRTTADTLSHTSDFLGKEKTMAAFGTFVVAIGFCVSLLFLMNGIIVFLFHRDDDATAKRLIELGCKDAGEKLREVGLAK